MATWRSSEDERMEQHVPSSTLQMESGAIHVVVPTPVLDRLRLHAVEAYPEECCGILVGRRDANAVLIGRELPCPNEVSGPERRRRFAIGSRRPA